MEVRTSIFLLGRTSFSSEAYLDTETDSMVEELSRPMNTLLEEHPLIDTKNTQPPDLYPQGDPLLKVYPPASLAEQHLPEKEILKWSGIHYVHAGKQPIKRRYRFFICDLSCFALFQTLKAVEDGKPLLLSNRSRKQKWKRISANTATKEVNKARKLAIRTLYTLGYDLGVVEITVFFHSPRYAVSKISNSLGSSSSLKEKLSDFLDRFKEKDRKGSQDVVLGTDVEFVLRHANGKYVMASKYLSKKGKVGYDAIWIRGHRNRHPLVELRPSPNGNPQKVFKDLYRCMKTAVKRIDHPQIEWLAGGRPLKGYPIGGHIHFSKVPLNAKLIRALDNYLTLPLFLLESDVSLSRRPKYGFIGDFREQPHGGFEYRTPPSWIVSPKITIGVLTLAKLIAVHYRELEWMPLNNYHVQKAFYEGQRSAIAPIVRELWESIRQSSSYSQYEKELDAFYELIHRQERWDEYADIRKAWHLPPYKN